MKTLKQELLDLAELNRPSMVSEVGRRLVEIAERLPENLTLGSFEPVMTVELSDDDKDRIQEEWSLKFYGNPKAPTIS